MALDCPADTNATAFFGENRTAALIEDLAVKGWAHAVRETKVPRLGLAGWFRVNPGVGGVLDPAN